MSNKAYRPTLAQLRSFVTIAEVRHFGSAANKLGISQPSLSQALVSLESGLNVQLIERSTRRVIVTPAGRELLPYATATLEAADRFLAQAHGVGGGLVGPVTLGIIPTIAPYLLPSFFDIVSDELPGVHLRIIEEQTANLLTGLREGSIDVAILALPIDNSGLETTHLYAEDFAVVCPINHPLAGRTDLSVSDLEGEKLLLLDDGHCLRDQVVELCRSADLQARNSVSDTRLASLATVMQCVAGGMGVTLIPSSAVEAEAKRPGLAIARFSSSVTASRTVGLCYRRSSGRADEFERIGNIARRAFDNSIK
ncbi:hydrogen peroxide-inducible genes activator [Corynebacterium aquilae]|uniref:Probable hydrogen peroxide-inducible genes activator n=1 Tax=Corynebacterium aquilae DSM 44791 TaxID=1431546 RepID=A0A1L7CGD9_9CORY|nr:hydrogen peroxide-inducible genes activator [Corynebacterium aquilae]APT84908.1 LysR family transcriptional regulator [Corynebacterium aquilae DSM 44791]